MSKLINILAASVGGGLVLGASIRLVGEVLRAKAAATRDSHSPASAEALPDWRPVFAKITDCMDRQQSEMDAIRDQMSHATRAVESVGAFANELRGELHRSLSRDLDTRIAAVEEQLRSTIEAANEQTVDTMVAALEKRVTPRIARLEEDIVGQASTLVELSECSIQTERSLQRLLRALERVVPATPGGYPVASFPVVASVNVTDFRRLAVMSNRAEDTENTAVRSQNGPFSLSVTVPEPIPFCSF